MHYAQGDKQAAMRKLHWSLDVGRDFVWYAFVMVERRIRVTREAFREWVALDTVVSRTLLLQVARGEEPETLRVYTQLAMSSTVANLPSGMLSW